MPSRPPSVERAPAVHVARGPFRIHAVAELTGVPEPTLRAWERRYGIPKPERSASGYRLYDASEVEQVRQLRRMCEDGMAASEAAKLLREAKPGGGAGPLPGDEEGASTPPSPFAAATSRVLDAIARFDDGLLDQELRKLMFLGTATAILDGVIGPVLYEVGTRWHQGELSVAQEHLASQRLGTLLRDLVRLSPGAQSESAVLLASFADDEHELGLLALALRLSGWGFRPIFLGARTPPGAVRSAVEALSPVLVALSVTVTPSAARARELVDDYANACRGVPWIVGGAGADELADRVVASGGTIAPGDSSELRRTIRSLIEGSRSVKPSAHEPNRRNKPAKPNKEERKRP